MKIQLSDNFTYSKLIRFVLPSVGMMIFMSIYGVVDGFFVSNYAGKTPFAAVNLIMPFLFILATVGFMFGTGGSALVAKAFGEQKPDMANRWFSLFVYISFIIGVILAVVSLIFLRPICRLLGAQGQLLDNCMVYGSIILLALPFNILQFLFQSFCVTAEKPNLGLWSTVSSGVTNMVLDAVLVVLLPQPWKLAGAAVATALAQCVGGIVPLIYFARPNSSILHLGKTRFDGKALWQASINGSSEFMSNIAMNLVGILYNLQLLAYAGEDGIAAYGVMMYVSMIFNGAFIGYSIGTSPIISYHYGAQNHPQLQNIFKKSCVILSCLGLAMLLSAELSAVPLSAIFVSYSQPLMDMTVRGFRIYSLAFPFIGFAIFGSGFFTALSDGLTSAAISFLRTLVFQVAAVILLPLIWELDGIWASVVAAEVTCVVLCAIFLIAKRKKYHYF